MIFEAPAKVNLALHVSPPDRRGYHPLVSIAQTLEWVDRLTFRESDTGADRFAAGDPTLETDTNLVMMAVAAARRQVSVRPLAIHLEKVIPVSAGLGGGSSDAAATLLAIRDLSGLAGDHMEQMAAELGADVTLFLTGGTMDLAGYGEVVTARRPLGGFAIAVVVPTFGLSSGEVFSHWDSMEGPTGRALADDALPPDLRGDMPMRNDLLPAALDLEPRLGDFMSDVRAAWGIPVALTGSGSACFGYFATIEEAGDAGEAVSGLCSVAKGLALRDRGVARVAEDDEDI